MPFESRVLTALLGLLTVACAHNPNPYAAWRTLKSEHFEMHSNMSDRIQKGVNADLEGVYVAIGQAFFPSTTLEPVEILLLEDPERVRDEVNAARAGNIHPVSDHRALVLTVREDYRWGEHVRSGYTTLHEQAAARELLSRFLKQNMRHAPPWFRTGMRAYVESVEVDGDKARFGHREQLMTRELTHGRVIPLRELIAAPAKAFTHGGERWRSHEASAWGLIHYLLSGENGTLRPHFDTLCAALIAGNAESEAASRTAFTKAFPELALEAVEGRARDYSVQVLGKRPTFHAMTRIITRSQVPATIDTADPLHVQALLAGANPH